MGVFDDGYDEEALTRTDAEIRQVLEYARAGIARYGFGEDLHPDDLARPWGNGRWQDNAWLRGVRDILERTGAADGTAPENRPGLTDLYNSVPRIDEVMRQGCRDRVRPGWPPPQSGEAWEATLRWLEGRLDYPPACQHGGVYTCDCPRLTAAAARGDAGAARLLRAYAAQDAGN